MKKDMKAAERGRAGSLQRSRVKEGKGTRHTSRVRAIWELQAPFQDGAATIQLVICQAPNPEQKPA